MKKDRFIPAECRPAGYRSLEICAGGGGQALGLEKAGFDHIALVEIEHLACKTLSANRPEWNVIQTDLQMFTARPYKGARRLTSGRSTLSAVFSGGEAIGKVR